MIYEFECKLCGVRQEKLWTVAKYEDVKKKVHCSECGGQMRRIWSPPALRFIGRGWPSQETKLDKEVHDVEEIMKVPPCDSEVRAGQDMLKEREKMLGYKEGRLTGNRPKPKVLAKT